MSFHPKAKSLGVSTSKNRVYAATSHRSSYKRAASRKRRKHKFKVNWLKLAQWLMVFSVIGLIAVIFAFIFFFIKYARDLPDPGEAIRRSGFSTKIVDRNGQVLYDLYNDQYRIPVKIDQVPQHLVDATVSIEDKDFYTHKGFDPFVLIRTPYYLIMKGRVVGGSTLTQQLVKKALLSDERSIERKFKQIVLAMAVEKKFSKDQILEMYLNEVPYGGPAYGVGAAAKMYFDKPVSDLTLVESAILAGLPQRPTAYSPFSGKKTKDGELLWQYRTKGVLRRMYEDGKISKEDYDQALKELDHVQFKKGKNGMLAPHFVFYVKDQLEKMYGPEVIATGGLTVKTSLDLNLQEEAEKIVAEEIDKVEKLNITNGAAMVMDPNTGEILVMVGSKDFYSDDIDGQFNVAVNGLRQPGSSIKPVVYLTLMRQKSYTPASMMIDTPTVFQKDDKSKPYAPKNYDGKFRGPVPLRYALASSLNIPAVKAIAKVGIKPVLDQAYKMGFVTLEPTKENLSRLGLSVALGGGEVHLIDSVTAYSAFANGGLRVHPVSILEVKNKDGKTIFSYKPEKGEQVATKAETFLIDSILSDDNARSLAFGLNSKLNISPYVAVKTGTTNDQRDNWAIGWSRKALVGAWVGNNDNSPMKRVASGISGATPIWRRIMLEVIDAGYKPEPWEQPEEVEAVEVDKVSGYPTHDGFPVRHDFAIKGTLPSLPDPYHTKLKLCRGEEKLATDAQIAAGDYEEKEFIVLKEEDPYSTDGKNRWQEGIDSWIAQNPDPKYHYPTEYCGDQGDVYVELKRPENEKTYAEGEIEFEIEADAGTGIEKIEILANGKVIKTVDSHEFKGKIKLEPGRYEVWAKAYSRDGKDKESRKNKIGVGGVSWEEPSPTPTPKPTKAVTPTPTKAPTKAPTATPTPTSVVASPTPSPTILVTPTP